MALRSCTLVRNSTNSLSSAISAFSAVRIQIGFVFSKPAHSHKATKPRILSSLSKRTAYPSFSPVSGLLYSVFSLSRSGPILSKFLISHREHRERRAVVNSKSLGHRFHGFRGFVGWRLAPPKIIPSFPNSPSPVQRTRYASRFTPYELATDAAEDSECVFFG
jgi:hypothetical protein